MKKLLVLALLPAAFASLATAVETEMAKKANRLAKFITMEENHKSKWFDYKKSVKAAKNDLAKKHHKELFELTAKKITELGKTGDVNTYLSSKLTDLIKLHEKHLQEEADFAKTWAAKAQIQRETEKAELAGFIQTLK